ncbi:TetR/AcrR family transcriptional regulator [Roseibium litorale]|uniref:TetR family transcriptional regulator n=1 Tax=Roseibium litorale TaxID=2803841 RepID=A0ABR9CMS4_9HYPH|nr:TetR/AcrR family transcriptional regulator [Roseibium litorale]MBD8892003.1 TetR family transcriptional regulator [Roseibium litorale]
MDHSGKRQAGTLGGAAGKPSASDDTRSTKGGQTAARVCKAALHLFARHGYAAVSMRQIASEVGVQPGALYNHFATKQDILKALMLEHMGALLQAWEACRGTVPEGTDLLEVFVRFHIRYHLSRSEEVFISYMELRNLEPENFAAVERLRQIYEAILTGILEDGMSQGRYRIEEPRVATRAIIAMLTGIPAWYRETGSLTAGRIETIYLDMVRGSLGAAPAFTAGESG